MAQDLSLYVLALPNASQDNASATSDQNVSSQGVLNSDSGNAEAISSTPGEITYAGAYADSYASKMAAELRELGSTTDETLPLFSRSGSVPTEGYYIVNRAEVNPVQPQTDAMQRYDITLTRKGTRATHWRATATNPSQVANEFGNDATAYVGVPAAASKVRWFDADTQSTESPTLVETRNAELGDVDIYDARASSFGKPTLIYELAYADEGDVDVRVWDTRGNSSQTDADGVLQWGKVFATGHDFASNAIVDTGLLRLIFDESANSLTAEQWDDTNTTWTSVSLGTSDWVLYDLDLYEIGGSRVVGQVVFENTTDGSQFHLDMIAHRGYATAQWVIPENESGPVPSGLVTKLNPVADTQDYDALASRAVVKRTEVRK